MKTKRTESEDTKQCLAWGTFTIALLICFSELLDIYILWCRK